MKKKVFGYYGVLTLILILGVNLVYTVDNSIPKTGNWGYGYNDLLLQLEEWGGSPWVTIDSIGASVQNRALWELSITDTTQIEKPKQTVYMHVRTHPNEVQSFRVANAFINLLLSDELFSQEMIERYIFYIVPMINPDGVELGYFRENANKVNIESNWATIPIEPEPAALKRRFIELMNSDQPIRIALNMHSAYNGNPRYFVYHHENGTSVEFTQLEKEFIGGVRSYFPSGIGAWDTFVSWTNGTPDYYPESWFWNNYGEDVMALTYEDWNNENAGDYDSTAYALLHGINDYLMNHYANINVPLPRTYSLYANYPNPFNSATTISYILYRPSMVTLSIFDSNGRLIETLVHSVQNVGKKQVQWSSRQMPSGIYFYQLKTPAFTETRKMTILK